MESLIGRKVGCYHLIEQLGEGGMVPALLNYPNNLNVFDDSEYEGSPYLVMELVPGVTLQQITRQVPPVARAAGLPLPIGLVMVYAAKGTLD